jgi:hypothetical protein
MRIQGFTEGVAVRDTSGSRQKIEKTTAGAHLFDCEVVK